MPYFPANTSSRGSNTFKKGISTPLLTEIPVVFANVCTQEETGFPKKQATPAVAADHTGYSVGYARYGFGESPFQDHTSAFKRQES
eukprot:1153628-Pelagomonas_calceolata.AAC.2